MKKEEFEKWWKDRWECCTASACVDEAYDLLRDLLASCRENAAELLERQGHTQAAALIRMTTVDGVGIPALDFWPAQAEVSGGGSGVSFLVEPGEIKLSAGSGRSLMDTTHQYPGLEAWREDHSKPFPSGKCKNNCGCVMTSASGAAAPQGVDPFGDCPAVEKRRCNAPW